MVKMIEHRQLLLQKQEYLHSKKKVTYFWLIEQMRRKASPKELGKTEGDRPWDAFDTKSIIKHFYHFRGSATREADKTRERLGNAIFCYKEHMLLRTALILSRTL